uniref:EPCAM/Trop-2 C-terminal domain-containing protein n=1 Tax=Falco tinnunculus TaxID=100819 RepID=A0A8C4VCS3_FALTI
MNGPCLMQSGKYLSAAAKTHENGNNCTCTLVGSDHQVGCSTLPAERALMKAEMIPVKKNHFWGRPHGLSGTDSIYDPDCENRLQNSRAFDVPGVRPETSAREPVSGAEASRCDVDRADVAYYFEKDVMDGSVLHSNWSLTASANGDALDTEKIQIYYADEKTPVLRETKVEIKEMGEISLFPLELFNKVLTLLGRKDPLIPMQV